MAAFLTTDAIAAEIRKIISEAVSELTLVTPSFKFTPTLFEEVRKAQSRGVSVTLIYEKASFSEEQSRWLSQAGNLRIYQSANLHANCYFNESRMLIASMGIEEISSRGHREMGILLRRERDKEPYRKAVNEVRSLMESSVQLDPRKDNLSGVASFLKQDLEKTVDDLRAAIGFLKKDLEKTKEDLNKEISLRKKPSADKSSFEG